jgi:hypothetical protein
MKKFLAIGITTLGGFGLLGLGATAASASIIPTAKSAVCTSATSQLAAQAPALASAGATKGNTATALSTANGTVASSSTDYVTTAMVVINDVDNLALPQQLLADTTTFNHAVTTFVNSVVAESNASVADFNAGKVLSQLNLQAGVLSGLISASCI